ncbi:flagellar biosynthetic protein FliR [Orenia metallireducens]|jgi:flagellar biosynthetic protein FliR|uniref:Flagellar biosynthetic protein FliR n=1 Tax=Orenia metallireducens TaxID=1413210 RepID=A0A1C0A9Y2_9FIRM|nr:flagellar biosynthetic protein FliR [Orenia metallireducens]OCL27100.1 flagellar biosynthetic protein FliR [Orenia metallireducens]
MLAEELINQVYYFILILARVLGFLLIAPIFGSKALPNKLKIGLAAIITIILLPIISFDGLEAPEGLLIISFQIVIELFIGFIIGFIMSLNFMALQLAGQFIDTRIGFAMASVIDPQNGIRSPLMGQFKNILATLLFLIINGHHYLLKALTDSFSIVGVTKFQGSAELVWALFRIIGELFPIGFRLALPIIAILFIVDLAFGLVARVVPQLNVFMMGMPTKVLVGMIFLIIILPSYINTLQDLFAGTTENIYNILKLMIERG